MKNFILKAIAYICFMVWITAACFVDSDSWIPFIIVCATSAWLILFSYANNWFEGYFDDGEQ